MKKLFSLLTLSLSLLVFGCHDHDHDHNHACTHFEHTSGAVTVQAGADTESPPRLNQHTLYRLNLLAHDSGYVGYVAVVIDEAATLAFYTPNDAVLTNVNENSQLTSEVVKACDLYEHKASAHAVGTMIIKIAAQTESILLAVEKETDDHDHT